MRPMKSLFLVAAITLPAQLFGQTTVQVLCSSPSGCGPTTLQSNVVAASGTGGAGGLSMTAGTVPPTVPGFGVGASSILFFAPQTVSTSYGISPSGTTAAPATGLWYGTLGSGANFSPITVTVSGTTTGTISLSGMLSTPTGTGYFTPPPCYFTSTGGGSGGLCNFSVSSGGISGVTLINGGSGYPSGTGTVTINASPVLDLSYVPVSDTTNLLSSTTGNPTTGYTLQVLSGTPANGNLGSFNVTGGTYDLVDSGINVTSVPAESVLSNNTGSAGAPLFNTSLTLSGTLTAGTIAGNVSFTGTPTFGSLTATSGATLGANGGSAGTLTLEGSTSGSATLITNLTATTIGASTQVEVPDNRAFVISQGASSTGGNGVQYGVIGTGTTEAADVTNGTSTNLINTGNKCAFALTTSTFTVALSPVSLCTFTLPNVANAWTWQCSMEWSNNAGTSPSFGIGVTWVHAPSAAFQMETIYTVNNSAPTKQISTTTTTNSTIGAATGLSPPTGLLQAFASGNFTASATSGVFSPTVILTGTGATGTATGQCMLL